MKLDSFIEKLNNTPEQISFEESIITIDENYTFTPGEFSNGDLTNAADQNNGSCKIFAFAKLNNISEDNTLHCFGKYYREDVLQHPDAEDHQNIRNFMKTGWGGIDFKTQVLENK